MRLAARLFAGLVLLGLGAGLPSTASAHEADAPHDDHDDRPSRYDPSEFRSKQYLALEFRVGPYRPLVDDEFGGATPFTDIFGDGESVALGLEVDWQALRIPHFGSLGPGVAWHFVRYAADSPLTADPSTRSRHPTALMIMPMAAVGVLRIDVLARDFSIPFVPYVKGGLSYAIWRASDAGNTSESADGSFGEGAELGLQAQFGGMLHLNWFAPQAALDMDNTSGVNHAYLFFEWMLSDVDSFDSGMQVGASTWFAGLALEY